MAVKDIKTSPVKTFQPSAELIAKKQEIYQNAQGEKERVYTIFNGQTNSLENKVKENASQLHKNQAKWTSAVTIITGVVLALSGWGLVAAIVAALAVGLFFGTCVVIRNLQDNSAWNGVEGDEYKIASQQRMEKLQKIDNDAARDVLFLENKERVEKAIIEDGSMWAILKDIKGNEGNAFLGRISDYSFAGFSEGTAFWVFDQYETRADGAVQAARQEIGERIKNGSLEITPNIVKVFKDDLRNSGYEIDKHFNVIDGNHKQVNIH